MASPSPPVGGRPPFTILSAQGGPLANVAARLQMGSDGRTIERFCYQYERANLRYVIGVFFLLFFVTM